MSRQASSVRYHLILLLMVLAIVVCSFPALAAKNVVANPGFENELTSWGPWKPRGNPDIVADTTIFYSGKAALRITGFKSDDRGTVGQRVTVEPGRTYRISFWIKTEDVKNPKAQLRIQFRNAKNELTRDALILGQLEGTNDWMLFEETVLLPEGTTVLLVEPFLDSSNGSVWFDDIEIIQVEVDDIALQTDLQGSAPLTVKPVASVVMSAKSFQAQEDAEGNIQLSWDLGDAKPSQLRLERSINTNTKWEELALLSVPLSEYADKELPAGVNLNQVRYRLTLIDSQQVASTPVVALLKLYIPPSPINLTKGTRPSLFITAEEIADLKKAAEENIGLRFLIQNQIEVPARMAVSIYGSGSFTLPRKGDLNGHTNTITHARNAALGYAFTGDEKMAKAACNILVAYARQYKQYPLTGAYDGRVTPQTLNEAHWIIDAAWAYDLLADTPLLSDAERLAIERDFLLESIKVIARYPKGLSNWQAWHNAGIGAVAFVLNDEKWIEEVLTGPQSFTTHIRDGIRADGLWWELAISYHHYTCNALTYLAEAAYRHGYDLYNYTANGKSLKNMFDAAIYHAFSDGRHPIVGNANFGFKLECTWSFGLAAARYKDPTFAALWYQRTASGTQAIPSVLYMPAITGGTNIRTLAIGTRNFSPAGYNIAGSTLLADSGVVILRGAPGPEVSVLYKPYGVRNGHQGSDALSINLEGTLGPWSSAPGAFNYSIPEQGTWYKHTVATNGVIVDETSQRPQGNSTEIYANDYGTPASGQLDHFLALPSVSLVKVSTDRVYTGVNMQRTLIVSAPYVIDRYQVQSAKVHQYDWVQHFSASESTTSVIEQPKPGALGTKAGYQHLTNLRSGLTDETWQATWSKGNANLQLTMLGAENTEVVRANGLGPNLSKEPMVLARRKGTQAEFLVVMEQYAKAPLVQEVHHLEGLPGYGGMLISRDNNQGSTVLDQLVWRNSDTTPSETVTLANGQRFQGELAFFRAGADGQPVAMLMVAGTLLEASGVSISADQATDVAVELADGNYLAVMHNGTSPRQLQVSLPASVVDGDWQLYRLLDSDQPQYRHGEAALVALTGLNRQVSADGLRLTWQAEAGYVYVLAAQAPADSWLARFSIRM